MIRDVIAEETLSEAPAGGYHPPGHRIGERVPKGGSMCANCSFGKEGMYCTNKYFQRWNAEVNGAKVPARLPAPADEYCCDNWRG